MKLSKLRIPKLQREKTTPWDAPLTPRGRKKQLFYKMAPLLALTVIFALFLLFFKGAAVGRSFFFLAMGFNLGNGFHLLLKMSMDKTDRAMRDIDRDFERRRAQLEAQMERDAMRRQMAAEQERMAREYAARYRNPY